MFANRRAPAQQRTHRKLTDGPQNFLFVCVLAAIWSGRNCSNHSKYGSLRLWLADLPEILMAPQNQTIKLGKAFVLECDADGNPLPSITWQFNGQPLASDGASADLLLENENTELVVSVAKQQHAGKSNPRPLPNPHPHPHLFPWLFTFVSVF